MLAIDKKSKPYRILKGIAVVTCLLFCEVFFFRNILDINALVGDRGDGRLTTLLAEHWWNFIRGNENFDELAMFYPASGVIGYTDMFLGYGIPFCILRALHFDMYIAYKSTLIIVHCIGTVSMYYLLKNKLNINVIWSLFGTIAFSYSDSFARHMGSTQLCAISALPILFILFLGFIRNLGNRKKRNIYAYSFISGFVLLTYNSWYVAYFTGLFCLIFIIVYLFKIRNNKELICPKLREGIRLVGLDVVGYIGFMAILYIPFLAIYVPVLRSSSGYSYGAVRSFLPEFADLINVTESNFMLGKVISFLKLGQRGYSWEVEEGFSSVLLGLFIVLYIIGIFKKNKRDRAISKTTTDRLSFHRSIIMDTAFFTVIVCVLSIVRLSANGVSLWGIIYHILPGAASVRAIARLWLWLSFPMSILVSISANENVRYDFKGGRMLSVFLLILLFLSNINTVGINHHWERDKEMDFVSSVKSPPDDLENFYIIDTAKVGDPAYVYQLDAFEIATWFNIKTINGYSGQTPQDWAGIQNVLDENYEPCVEYWIEKYDLQNVYAYDRATNNWIKFEDRLELFKN